MDFIKAIIKPSYWLTQQYPVPEFWKYALTVFFGTLLVFGLVTALLAVKKKFRKPYRTLFSKLATWAWTVGLIGYAFLFFSVQRIALVSARLVYLFWLSITLLWLYYIVRYAVKRLPVLIEKQKEKEMKEKYLPKKKK